MPPVSDARRSDAALRRTAATPPTTRRTLDLDARRRARRVSGRRHALLAQVFASAVDQVIVLRHRGRSSGPALRFPPRLTREADATRAAKASTRVLLEGQALPPQNERHAARAAGRRRLHRGRAGRRRRRPRAHGGRTRSSSKGPANARRCSLPRRRASARRIRPRPACRTIGAAAAKPFDRLRARSRRRPSGDSSSG